MIDRRALLHKLNASSFIGGNVANGEHPVRQVRTAGAARQPGHGLWVEEGLGVGDRDESRGVRRPVDAVDQARGEWCNLQFFLANFKTG